jgi:cytoskeleton-associated protein 5
MQSLSDLQGKKPVTASAGPAAPAASAVKKAAPTTAAAASKPSKASAAPTPGALDSFKYRHTPEDAEGLAADLIPSNIMTDLGDANWKTRLAALEEMTGWVESAVEELDAEVVVRALAKKGWAEKNFQVGLLIAYENMSVRPHVNI